MDSNAFDYLLLRVTARFVTKQRQIELYNILNIQFAFYKYYFMSNSRFCNNYMSNVLCLYNGEIRVVPLVQFFMESG